MNKKTNKPQGIPLRSICGDDRNYDMLVEENYANRDRLTQITIADMRNGGIVSDAQIEARKAHQSTQLLVGAIKQEKKILETIGLNQTKQQSKKANLKRPVKNDLKETLDDVIIKLNRNNPGSKPGELWPHLKAAISDWSSDTVIEIGDKVDGSRKYQFKVNEKAGTISFDTFRKKLSKLRIGF